MLISEKHLFSVFAISMLISMFHDDFEEPIYFAVYTWGTGPCDTCTCWPLLLVVGAMIKGITFTTECEYCIAKINIIFLVVGP